MFPVSRPPVVERTVHPARRGHLDVLAGPFGIWQHAAGNVPDEAFGSCTDDVARALTVDLLQRHQLGWDAVKGDAGRSLEFLREAHDPATGCFRNFRAADGSWLESAGSQDSQGRALLALGIAVAEAPDAPTTSEARALFLAAAPGVIRLTALRAIASSLLACDAVLSAGLDAPTRRTFDRLARRLRRAFASVDVEGAWPWPEPTLTYENALLPRALLAAGIRLGDAALQRTALRVLDWLLRVQTAPGGWFRPIGSEGWWPRGGARAVFDQQPIEATATILAARAALDATGDPRYARAAEAAYAWFLGANDLGIDVALPRTGGCHDGLSPRGVNRNQGAESTLMWLAAVELVRSMRSRVPAAPRRQTPRARAIAGGSPP